MRSVHKQQKPQTSTPARRTLPATCNCCAVPFYVASLAGTSATCPPLPPYTTQPHRHPIKPKPLFTLHWLPPHPVSLQLFLSERQTYSRVIKSAPLFPFSDCSLPAVLLQLFLPESPRWLALSGAPSPDCEAALRRTKGSAAEDSSIDAELALIQRSCGGNASPQSVSGEPRSKLDGTAPRAKKLVTLCALPVLCA